MTGHYLEQKADEAECAALAAEFGERAARIALLRRRAREHEDKLIRAARVELWLEYRAARHAGDPVSPSGLRRVGQELGLC